MIEYESLILIWGLVIMSLLDGFISTSCLSFFVLFQSLMTDETIANVPILILGNKIDRPEAISEERLREMFGLYGQTTGKVNNFFGQV